MGSTTKWIGCIAVPLFSILIGCASDAPPTEPHGESVAHLEDQCDAEGLLGEGTGCDDRYEVCVRRDDAYVHAYVCELRPVTNVDGVDCSGLGDECGPCGVLIRCEGGAACVNGYCMDSR